MDQLPFSGTTNECLQNFFWRHRWEAAQQFVSEYAGVDKSTVRHWKNGRMPSGDPLLRVRVLLNIAGYAVEEYEALPRPTQQFAQIIALRLIDVREAADLLGYKNIQDIYGVVLRSQGLMPHRQFRLERYVENSATELGQAVAELQSKLEQLPKEGVAGPATEPELATPGSGVPDTPEPAPRLEKGERHPHIIPAWDERLVVALSHNLHTAGWLAVMVADTGEEAKKLLGAILSEDELRLIVKRIEALLPNG